MPALTQAARAWLADKTQAVLVTLRADGTPQSSNIVTHFDGAVFSVSVTASRAKTRNLARDPRAVLHVLGENFWSYASVTCTASLSTVSVSRGDQTGRDLLALHEAIIGTTHSDPDEFFDGQVREQRLLLTLTPHGVTGMGWQ